MPGILVYSAVKSFVTFLAEGLHYELKNKVDVMSYAPGYVSTNLTNNRVLDKETITA